VPLSFGFHDYVRPVYLKTAAAVASILPPPTYVNDVRIQFMDETSI
jgi:hypothetical protein